MAATRSTSPSKPVTKGSLLVIFLTVFIDLLGFGMVLPLLPIYAVQFTADESGLLIGLLMASFSAMQFLFAPVWGRISDRIGRRPVLMVGLAGSVIFYTLFGLATVWRNVALLFVTRIGAGIAGATIPTAQAYIADSTTVQTRAKGMALIGAAFGLGFTFGPLFGYLAVPSGKGDPGPGPGYAAAALSAIALLLAYFKLPESLNAGSQRAGERRLLDLGGLRSALSTPSVGPLLLTLFVCVFAFANFETTLSMLVKGDRIKSGFQFDFQQVCLTYAYIGLMLTLAQGVLVRRLSTRLPEALMASGGAVGEIIGFSVLISAVHARSLPLLLAALAVVVCGFAFMMPSLNSLISRRSDPAKQGGILGVAQSVSSLARILGPMFGIPLLELRATLPYYVASALMAGGLLLVIVAARGGKDYVATT
ncbi:MAG: MFS transporter [Planctomycetes bacterium]|nr:MFS transporter [Planctomycetota bacterium]